MKPDHPTLYPCPACSNQVIPDSPFCPHCGHSLQAHSATLRQSGPASQPAEKVTPATLIQPGAPGAHATIIQPLDQGRRATIIQSSNPGIGATIINSPAHQAHSGRKRRGALMAETFHGEANGILGSCSGQRKS